MGTNRVRTKRGAVSKLSGPTERHLLLGCCLLWKCEVCHGGPGMARAIGKQPYELTPDAERIWKLHRTRLLGVWNDETGTPEPRGFDVESLRGAGKWVPCFGEVKFDGAKLPKRAASRPSAVKKLWEEIRDNLER